MILVGRFEAFYPWDKAYSDFCYQNSITARISTVTPTADPGWLNYIIAYFC